MITLPPATPFTLIAKLFLYVLNEFVFACLKFSTTYTRGPSQGERRAFLQGGGGGRGRTKQSHFYVVNIFYYQKYNIPILVQYLQMYVMKIVALQVKIIITEQFFLRDICRHYLSLEAAPLKYR